MTFRRNLFAEGLLRKNLFAGGSPDIDPPNTLYRTGAVGRNVHSLAKQPTAITGRESSVGTERGRGYFGLQNMPDITTDKKAAPELKPGDSDTERPGVEPKVIPPLSFPGLGSNVTDPIGNWYEGKNIIEGGFDVYDPYFEDKTLDDFLPENMMGKTPEQLKAEADERAMPAIGNEQERQNFIGGAFDTPDPYFDNKSLEDFTPITPPVRGKGIAKDDRESPNFGTISYDPTDPTKPDTRITDPTAGLVDPATTGTLPSSGGSPLPLNLSGPSDWGKDIDRAMETTYEGHNIVSGAFDPEPDPGMGFKEGFGKLGKGLTKGAALGPLLGPAAPAAPLIGVGAEFFAPDWFNKATDLVTPVTALAGGVKAAVDGVKGTPTPEIVDTGYPVEDYFEDKTLGDFAPGGASMATPPTAVTPQAPSAPAPIATTPAATPKPAPMSESQWSSHLRGLSLGERIKAIMTGRLNYQKPTNIYSDAVSNAGYGRHDAPEGSRGSGLGGRGRSDASMPGGSQWH